MGIYIIALYFGNSLGPLITGFIVQGKAKRRTLLHTTVH